MSEDKHVDCLDITELSDKEVGFLVRAKAHRKRYVIVVEKGGRQYLVWGVPVDVPDELECRKAVNLPPTLDHSA